MRGSRSGSENRSPPWFIIIIIVAGGRHVIVGFTVPPGGATPFPCCQPRSGDVLHNPAGSFDGRRCVKRAGCAGECRVWRWRLVWGWLSRSSPEICAACIFNQAG